MSLKIKNIYCLCFLVLCLSQSRCQTISDDILKQEELRGLENAALISEQFKDLLDVLDLSLNNIPKTTGKNFSDSDLRLIATITPVLDVSEKCFKDSITYIEALNNASIWALMLYDANGKLPSGILSSVRDGCDLIDFIMGPGSCEEQPYGFLYKFLKIPHGNTVALGSVQACIFSTVPAPFTPKFVYVKTGNPSSMSPFVEENLGEVHTRLSNEKFLELKNAEVPLSTVLQISPWSWGRCIPSSCSSLDINNNNKALFQNLGFKTHIVSELTVDDTKYESLPPKTIGFISLLGLLCVLLLVGTVIDIWQHASPHRELLPSADKQNEGTIVQILKCFSILENGRKILNTDVPKGESFHLGCISGIRVISILWVILGHTYGAPAQQPLQNPSFVENFIFGKFGASAEVLLNAFPSVDTFFFLSGTLVAYLTFAQLEKGSFNIFVFYIHRYIRLTIPYAFVIGFTATVLPYMSWGLNWKFAFEYAGYCETNGWTNVLYINNFVKQSEMCIGVSWYLANDMQFYLLSPLFILPLWYNFWMGLLWCLAVLVGVTILTGYFVLQFELPPTHLFIDFFVGLKDGFIMNEEFYQRPYIRFQPYVIGILFGYMLYKTRGKQFKIPHAVNFILWQIALVTGIVVVYGLAGDRYNSGISVHGYSLVDSMFYSCFHRIAWSLSLAWVMFSCIHGYGGIINSFLSWGLFLPFARLSYMAYLIHPEVLLLVITSADYSIQFSNLLATQNFIGIVVITFAASFVASLAFESPFMCIEKIVLKALMGSKRQSGHSQPNGIGPNLERDTLNKDENFEPSVKTEVK